MPGFTPPDGTTVLAPSSAVPGWTAEYAVPLGGPGHLLLATFEQAAIGIAHLTLAEEWISVNQRYCEITGYSREEILKLKLEDLTHPDDVPASKEFIGRIRSGELPEYRMEKRYVRKDGEVIWVHQTVSIVRAVTGDPLYLVGFIDDITDRRNAQREASRSFSLLRATLESTADGILVVDLDGKILSFNQKMADMWDIPAEIFSSGDDQRAIGAALDKLVHPDDFMAKVMELYRHPEEASYDVLQLKDGRIFERYSQPQRIDDVAVGRVWSFRDVTARTNAEEQTTALVREQAARAEAENSEKRAALLAEASRVLSASFDYQTTLAALVRLAVPALADYCALDIVAADDSFERIGEAHVDPAKSMLLKQVATFPRSALTAYHPLIRVITTGEPVLEREITPAFIRASFSEPEQRSTVEALEPLSLICVPLVNSGKPLGALTLVTSNSGRRFEIADRPTESAQYRDNGHEPHAGLDPGRAPAGAPAGRDRSTRGRPHEPDDPGLARRAEDGVRPPWSRLATRIAGFARQRHRRNASATRARKQHRSRLQGRGQPAAGGSRRGENPAGAVESRWQCGQVHTARWARHG